MAATARPTPVTGGFEAASVVFLISAVVAAASVGLALTCQGAWSAAAANPGGFASFVVLTCALALVSVPLYGRGSYDFSGAGVLAAGFAFGVGAAMATALIATAVHYARMPGKPHRAIFSGATLALAGAAGTLPSAVFAGPAEPFGLRVTCAIAAAPAYLAVNVALLSVAMGLTEDRRAIDIWRDRFRWMTPYYLAAGPLALALVVADERVGAVGLFAFSAPPLFMMLSVRQYLSRTRAAVEEVEQVNLHLSIANATLAARNDDLAKLLELSGGFAAQGHDRDALVSYAETALSRLTGARARIRIGPGDGGEALLVGSRRVGTLSLIDEGRFDRERWARLRDAVLPQLAAMLDGVVLVERIRKTHLETISALSRSMEAKDYYTGGHTERVAAVSVALARRLGYTGTDLDAIEIGALLHDVGKIGIPEHILHKPGPLDDDEWAVMREHPIISDTILAGIDLPEIVRQIARSSHERIDGAGYPDGLAGDDVPLPARIVLVADAFDALTTDRPYRAGRPSLAALEEMRRNNGTQFCPVVMDALERLFREEPQVLAVSDSRPVAAVA